MKPIHTAAAILLASGAALVNAETSGNAGNPPDANVLTLGGGVAVAARYSGSDELQAAPVIAIDYQMANGFYASTMRGLGYSHRFGQLELSAALGYRGERSDKEESGFGGRRGSKKLKGMGEVRGSATGVLGAGFSIGGGLVFSAHAELPLAHRENGRTAGVALTATLFDDKTDQVTLSLGANFADRKYAQTYYGVTAAQSAGSGYRQFKPAAGMYEGVLSMSWQHRVDQRWSVSGMLGYSTLVRDAARSPLALRSNSPTAAVYASYRY